VIGDHLPWSTLNIGHQIPKDPKLSIFRAASWLQNCLQTHDRQFCKNGHTGLPDSAPTRLIFLGNGQNQLRLVEGHHVKAPYTALSYCWGRTQHISTLKSNYDHHLRNIPWSSLAVTYQDAMSFTRALGYKYIWIDSLCIVQDDREDWHHEAAGMADIYGQAIVVISAANANHAGFGCFHERPGSRTFRNKLQKGPRDPSHILVQEPNVHSNLMRTPRLDEQWPLFRRAWTLQERMLATRIVHFGPGELIWECATTSDCECGHLSLAQAVTSRTRYDLSRPDRMTDVQRANLWDELALSYQNRLLTAESDRLSALSGLAHRFQSPGLGKYVAGLWSAFALSMLLWEAKTETKTNRRRTTESPEFVAPSWSWASYQGRLLRNDPVQPNDVFEATLLEIDSTLKTPDIYGAIDEGHILLSSPVTDGTIIRSERHGHPMIQLGAEMAAFLVSDMPIPESLIGGGVKCLFLRGLHPGPSGQYLEALVLTLSKDMQTYERLGIAHIRKHSLGQDGEQQKTLPLVVETVKII